MSHKTDRYDWFCATADRPMIQRFLTNFFRWWLKELAALLPAKLRQAVTSKLDAVIVTMNEDRLTVAVRRNETSMPVGSGGAAELAEVLKTIEDRPPLLLLRAPKSRLLCKRLSLPFAAGRDLPSALSLAIDRETPFECSEVCWGYRVLHADKKSGLVDIELVLVPRQSVAPAMRVIHDAGVRVSALDMDTPGVAYIWIDGIDPRSWLRSQRRLAPVALAALALLLMAIVTPFAVQQLRLYLADRAISAARLPAQEAATMRRSITERVAAMKYFGRTHQAGGSALATLAAVTSALPDDSFLTALSLHGGRLTMTGSSEQAAKLIAALSRSAAFREPNFDSSIVAESDAGLESFTISAALVPAGAP
jgi:general secretion pathway protein L